jgi:hypothetical protein
MSVGGTVIETIITGDLVWINTKESPKYRSECAIYVENTPEARSVSEGDIIWWQGNIAYWTAKDRHGRTVGRKEVELKRRGFSGVARPQPIVLTTHETQEAS